MKLKLLTTSILTGVLLTSYSAVAAKYKVTEITPLDKFQLHYAVDIGDNGQVVGEARGVYAPKFYLEDYLSTFACDLTDEELSSGQFDLASTACVYSEIASKSGDEEYQKLGGTKSFISNETTAELTHLVDEFDAELGDYTFSNDEELKAVNAQGIAVGTASGAFSTIMFEQTGDNATSEEPIKMWQRDYYSRAVISINGEIREIEPEFSQYGGKTSASDISNNGYIAGASSVSILDSALETLEENCTGELKPVSVCVWERDSGSNIYAEKPVIWKVDVDGNLESSTVYEIGYTPEENQTTNFRAEATAVNDSGVGVGFGQYVNGNFLVEQPLLFKDGETISFIDTEEYFNGKSYDINDEGIVVGTINKDNTTKTQIFIYDINSGELSTPDTFYQNAESIAFAINNAGLVVGKAEYEVTTDLTRREHGFLYDSVKKEFFDMNNLIQCDSAFDIVQGNAINNNGEIVATALKIVDKRNALGEVIFDDNGVAEQEQVPVAVLLEPIEGEVENCTELDNPPNERKGVSNSIALSFGLFLVTLFRRKKLIKN